MNGLLPWHRTQWALISSQRANYRLPHALLLQGREGLGKRQFANILAQGLLCESPTGSGEACGGCRFCHLFDAQTHPDLFQVEPEEGRNVIVIGQIRALTHFIALKSAQSEQKVAVISPAERMNRHAANSLLKTLEEPPPDTLLMLVSHVPSLLPATIRSRCQKLTFGTPAVPDSLPWLRKRLGADAEAERLLRLANGSPLQAVKLAERDALKTRAAVLEQVTGLVSGKADPVTAAEDWLDLGFADTLDWLYGIVTDLIRLKSGAMAHGPEKRAAERELTDLSQRLDFGLLFKLLDTCLDGRRVLERDLNLNPQLLLENMAVIWACSK